MVVAASIPHTNVIGYSVEKPEARTTLGAYVSPSDFVIWFATPSSSPDVSKPIAGGESESSSVIVYSSLPSDGAVPFPAAIPVSSTTIVSLASSI